MALPEDVTIQTISEFPPLADANIQKENVIGVEVVADGALFGQTLQSLFANPFTYFAQLEANPSLSIPGSDSNVIGWVVNYFGNVDSGIDFLPGDPSEITLPTEGTWLVTGMITINNGSDPGNVKLTISASSTVCEVFAQSRGMANKVSIPFTCVVQSAGAQLLLFTVENNGLAELTVKDGVSTQVYIQKIA